MRKSVKKSKKEYLAKPHPFGKGGGPSAPVAKLRGTAGGP